MGLPGTGPGLDLWRSLRALCIDDHLTIVVIWSVNYPLVVLGGQHSPVG